MSLYCQSKAVKYGLIIFLTLLQGFSTTRSCNFIAEMKQTLHNDGFHRNLTYNLSFYYDNMEENWLMKGCIISLDQVMPAGVYADPDQLTELGRLDKLTALVANRVNSELPTEQSQPSNILVIGAVEDNKASLWVPLHARYHFARPGGGQVKNIIEGPQVYLHCPGKRLEMCDMNFVPGSNSLCDAVPKHLCRWREISYTSLTKPLIWSIPVGNTNHYVAVGAVTAIVVVMGSLYLIKTIHIYTVTVKWKKLR